jgi:excisionase family DNA binding protein
MKDLIADISDEFLTIEEVAKALKLPGDGVKTIQAMVNQGRINLEGWKVARQWRFNPKEVREVAQGKRPLALTRKEIAAKLLQASGSK